MFTWYTPIVISLISSSLDFVLENQSEWDLCFQLGCSCFSLIKLFCSKYIFNSLSIFAFQSISFASSFDAVSTDNVRDLKQLSIPQTILTKSSMYLTNLLVTMLSRNIHCLIRPLALSTSHLTFVINLDLFASSVVCCLLPQYNGFWHYIPDPLDIKRGLGWLNELGRWI